MAGPAPRARRAVAAIGDALAKADPDGRDRLRGQRAAHACARLRALDAAVRALHRPDPAGPSARS